MPVLTKGVLLLAAVFPHAHHSQPGCSKTYTVHMARRAADAVYMGTRNVSKRERGMLVKILHCQRNPQAGQYVRWFYNHQQAAWEARRNPPMYLATVSWYNDAGNTASGWHATYGVAVCGQPSGVCVPFGTKIRFCFHGCVDAVADDHGPYVAGRAFDLNQNTAGAIGFDGVAQVRYSIR